MRVELQQVHFVYARREGPFHALGPLSLQVPSGQFVALVGPSGCGKTTLLRLVADQLQPTRGRVLLDGLPPQEARKRKAIGWMAQHPALLPWATVLDNVRLPLRVNRGHGRPFLPPEELLRLVGLEAYARAYPHTLSGGQQQRVALARTLATGARVWLMDEPFAALDELTREALAEEVVRLWRAFGTTVLWVTHHIPEAVRLADRVVVLDGPPARLRADIPIPLPRPRDDTHPEVTALIRQVRQALGRKP